MIVAKYGNYPSFLHGHSRIRVAPAALLAVTMAGEALLIGGGLLAALCGLVGAVAAVSGVAGSVMESSWASAALWLATGLVSVLVAAVGTVVHYVEVNECWNHLGFLVMYFGGGPKMFQQGANPEAGTLIGELVLRAMRDGNRADREAMLVASGAKPGMSIIEIGCADGHLLLKLAEACAATKAGTPTGRVLGVDVSEGAARAATRRLQRLGDDARVEALAIKLDFAGKGSEPASALPAPDSSVDVVVHSHCVYFWPDLASGAHDIARVLRPGGLHVFVVAPAEVLNAHLKRPGTPFKNVHPSEWTSAFEAAGLEVEAPIELPGTGRGSLWRMRKPLS